MSNSLDNSPQSISAINSLINQIRDSWLALKEKQYEERKASNPAYPDRRPGWKNRDARVRDRAMKMAGL